MCRDMVWHELFDRMKEERCPICELIFDRIKRSMDGFLYEGINDPMLRDKICKSNGLCNYHAYMLMDMGDPLAHALIYHDLLERAMHYIQAPSIKQQAGIYQSHPDCLFCRQAKESEDIYMKAFISAFGDEEFRTRYMDGGLLCVPHLELIKTERKQKNIEKIKEATLHKYEDFIHQLSEIRRKNDYRFSGEPWSEQEKTAWKRAVSIINALRGIRQ